NALAGLGGTLATQASRGWQRFRDASASKASALMTWTAGIPGRISRAIGGLGSLLYNHGRNVVLGLWHGIRDMGGWLRDTLSGWAADIIPGPIADALGIGSPSKVLAEVVGRWLPAGIAMGAEDNRGVLDRTMTDLVNPKLARPGASAAMAMGTGAGGRGRTGVLRIEFAGPEEIKRIVRKIVADDGGGDVQLALGS
ncbi:MAG TPA: hypothetical protein VIQ30_13325, partial [Pseudonocardia sp.]